MKKNSSARSTFFPTCKKYFGLFNHNKLLMLLLMVVIAAGCKKVVEEPGVNNPCPLVVSTDPMDKAVDVALAKVISATFNADMDPATLNNATFIIMQGTTRISGTVAPTALGTTFTFKPDVPLLPFTTYTGTITTGAKDKLGTAMAADYVWSFTTIPLLRVSSNPVAGGTTTGGGTFAQGSNVTVSARPNAGYTFTNWTDSGSTVVASTSSDYTFKMNGNRTLIANYTLIPPVRFAIMLSSNPPSGGGTFGQGSYNIGSPVTVIAFPNPGFTFVSWTESGIIVSTTSRYDFIATRNRTLVANFIAIPTQQFSVFLSSNPPTGGTTTGTGSYAAGSSVTVTATPNSGFTFTNFTENGNIVSTSSSYTFVINSNRTLVANFTAVAPAPAPLFSSIFGAFGIAGITNQGINTLITNGSIGTTAASTLITGFHDMTGDSYTETPLNIGNVRDGRIYTDAPPPVIFGPGGPYGGNAQTKAIADAGRLAALNFYNSISPANRPATILASSELGGLTLPPGTYRSPSGPLTITSGNLTLDAQGDPNAVWVFQAPSSLTVGVAGPTGAKSVTLINGAQSRNVYWWVGTAATINGAGGGVMVGTIISSAGITFSTAGNTVQTVLNGRAISLNASVTMVNTTINVPN